MNLNKILLYCIVLQCIALYSTLKLLNCVCWTVGTANRMCQTLRQSMACMHVTRVNYKNPFGIYLSVATDT